MKYVELGGSEALAGVGRANNASNVGNANYVHGVAGSNTFQSCGFHGLCRYQTETAKHKQR